MQSRLANAVAPDRAGLSPTRSPSVIFASAAGLAWVASVLSLVWAFNRPASAPRGLWLTTGWALAWRLDMVGAMGCVLVTTVLLSVLSFSSRYLAGTSSMRRTLVLLLVSAVAAASMACAASPLALALGWTISGRGLVALVRTSPASESAAAATRRTSRTLLFSDLALWSVVVLLGVTHHPLLLGGGSVLQAPGTLPSSISIAIGALILVAAAARCGLSPFGRWLHLSVAAPTPVSAFLHAGIVNAGGILLILMAPWALTSLGIRSAVIAVGAISVVVGSAAMMSAPDIKGALARSTSAQMGFMIVCCGLGLYGAALLHLAAHGMYKSTLFLGSSGVVQRHATDTMAPRRVPTGPMARLLLGVVIPIAIIGAIASGLGPTDAPGILLAVLLATAVMAASLASLDRLANRSLQIVFSVALSLLAGAYLLLAGWIQSRLGLPPVGWTNDLAIPITLLAVLGVTLGALALISDRDIAPVRSISDRLWVAAANVGVNDRLSSSAVGGTA